MKRSSLLSRLKGSIPSLISAVALAIAIWVLAVTSTDPVEKRAFGRAVEIEVVGLDPALVITSDIPDQVNLTLSAPVSTWETDLTASGAVRAIADLSGLEKGDYSVPISVQVAARPAKIELVTPSEIEVSLDELYSESFSIVLFQPSSPAVGYEAGNPVLNKLSATVNGPSKLVNQVESVQAVLDISQANEDIDEDLELNAIDENGLVINGVTITPATVNVKMAITQRGGYRNVPVKVVTSGQIESGYRLTDITSSPILVTVFSTDTALIDQLPGFVETIPLNLDGANEDTVVSLPLDLPGGVTVVGESTIRVSVSIAPIQGSLTLNDLPVETIGIPDGLIASLSPAEVDIILSGPLPTLDELIPGNIRVFLDLTDFEAGTYQLEPAVEINVANVLVQSLLPSTIEIDLAPPVAE